jgi:catechol 2,3-dioxygenase-like lactoylglutathione lyase family enzyme
MATLRQTIPALPVRNAAAAVDFYRDRWGSKCFITTGASLAAIPANRLAAAALAELLSRRRSCERIAEALVRWARVA